MAAGRKPLRLPTDKFDVLGRRIHVGDFVVAFNEYKSYRGTVYWVVKDNAQKLTLIGTRTNNSVFEDVRALNTTMVGLVLEEFRGYSWDQIRHIRANAYNTSAIGRSPRDNVLCGLHLNHKYSHDLMIINDVFENLPEDLLNPPIAGSEGTVLDMINEGFLNELA